jgi:hypothetical protein
MMASNADSGTNRMAQGSTDQTTGGSTIGSSSGLAASGSSTDTENLTTGGTQRLKGASSDAKSGSPAGSVQQVRAPTRWGARRVAQQALEPR